MKKWLGQNKTIGILLLIHLIFTEILLGIKNQGKSIESVLEVRKNIFGGMYDTIIIIVFSSVLGAIFIYLFWNMIFQIVKNKKRSYAVMIVLALIGNLYIYPKQFYFFETDNALVYKQAVLNQVDYWQGMYMTCIYKACMLVFPLPIVIPVIQTVALLMVLWHLFLRMKNIWGAKAYLLGIVFLFPELYEIAFNPYRNCINALICIALYGTVFLDAIEGRKREEKQLLFIGSMVAFVCVFRSEGIVHFVVYLVACRVVYQLNNKELIRCTCALLCFLLLFGIPQKIGRSQYYEKEYSIVNYMQVLQDIFNDEECNLSYEGADKDIEVLSKAVPYDMVKKIGMVGFRYHNYEQGRNSNQSDLTKEEQQETLKAIYNILKHNPKMMFSSRLAGFCSANGMEVRESMGIYFEGNVDQMDAEYLSAAEDGIQCIEKDSYGILKCWDIEKDPKALTILQITQEKTHVICFYIKLIIFLMFGLLALYYAGKYTKKHMLFWASSAGALYLQLIGIILLSPEGRSEYYFPSFLVMFIGSMLLLIETIRYEKDTNKK